MTKIMSDGFIKVTRKRWIGRKRINNQNILRDKAFAMNCNNVGGIDIEHFLRKLNNVRLQMQTSDYFKGALNKIDEAITKLEDCNEISISNGQYLKRLVCFGIGSFTSSYHSLHQLAFILCAQKHYKITDAVFFDPVFQTSEKEILQRLDCRLMNENCEAKYEADVKTLFYLPHCAKCLTNNLLWRNWHKNLLKNIILINNSFKSLSCDELGRALSEEFEIIVDIIPYTLELSIRDRNDEGTFNDLSVHIFPPKQLPPSSSKFWLQRKKPSYKYIDAVLLMDNKDQN